MVSTAAGMAILFSILFLFSFWGHSGRISDIAFFRLVTCGVTRRGERTPDMSEGHCHWSMWNVYEILDIQNLFTRLLFNLALNG